jgi:hypothetical protein
MLATCPPIQTSAADLQWSSSRTIKERPDAPIEMTGRTSAKLAHTNARAPDPATGRAGAKP